MEPYKHLLISTMLGVFGFLISNDISIFFLTIFFGSFVDFDHYFEFLYTSGYRNAFNIKEFYSSKHFIESNRLIIIFHSWEYVGLLSIATILNDFNILFVFITLGYSSHIILDFIGNYDLKRSSYFIIVRIIYKFERSKLVRPEYLQVTGSVRNEVRMKLNSGS